MIPPKKPTNERLRGLFTAQRPLAPQDVTAGPSGPGTAAGVFPGLLQAAGEVALGAVPGVGQAMDVRDFEQARREGSPVGMGLATLGLVPVVGDVGKVVARGAADRVRQLFTGTDPSRLLPSRAHAAAVKERSTIGRSLESAETGEPFAATLKRGEGKNLGERPSVAGGAQYSTPSERHAQSFGAVRDVDVRMKKPLVIENDDQWRTLTQQAGWKFPNPSSLPSAERAIAGDNLQRAVTEMGYDGIVVRIPKITYGSGMFARSELDERMGKTLDRVFGADQAIEFTAPRRPAGQYP
jgi:hypothetical protein